MLAMGLLVVSPSCPSAAGLGCTGLGWAASTRLEDAAAAAAAPRSGRDKQAGELIAGHVWPGAESKIQGAKCS